MGIFRPLKPSKPPVAVEADIEGDIRDLVGKAPPRHSSADQSEITPTIICDAIRRVAGGPMSQLDRMIAELTQLREHMQNESERVQDEIARVDSEIADYTQMSEAAVQSIRTIDQVLGKFKSSTSVPIGIAAE